MYFAWGATVLSCGKTMPKYSTWSNDAGKRRPLREVHQRHRSNGRLQPPPAPGRALVGQLQPAAVDSHALLILFLPFVALLLFRTRVAPAGSAASAAAALPESYLGTVGTGER